MLITSLQNERIKYAVKLWNRRSREEEKRTLLEGYRAITRANQCRMKIEECFYCPSMFLGENENELLAKLAESGTVTTETTDRVFAKLAYRDRPEGLIAIAEAREHRLDDLPFVKNGLYLVAERIEKPGNLGAILRSADAAGASGIIVCDKCTDIYNPNVITASTGTLFSVPLAETSSQEAALWLKKNGIRTLAATPHTDKNYTDIDMTAGIAIVVGAEQYGLSEFWLKNSDISVKISMLGLADSLNVSTATTILLYEAARQRGWRKST
ncbi:MAG: rRNA methyltransferase [Lentisphaerae bacterium GWF2_49_21]|nr:MAG: rRNA methyltransferase [Lentisphaerae bacterium GWF2_49_21]